MKKKTVSSGDIPNWTFSSIKAVMESLRFSDAQTYEHCLRVGEVCRKLARDMGLTEYEQRLAHFAGMLHDVGKVGIHHEILHKPSRLSSEEFEIMKNHPIMSEQILKPISAENSFLTQLLPGVRGHHERIDGSGYPDRLVGDQIPLTARIILVADTYDAMLNNRAYRNGLPIENIYAELKRCAGTQFDFQIVRIFLESQPKWNEKKDIDQEIFEKIIKKSA